MKKQKEEEKQRMKKKKQKRKQQQHTTKTTTTATTTKMGLQNCLPGVSVGYHEESYYHHAGGYYQSLRVETTATTPTSSSSPTLSSSSGTSSTRTSTSSSCTSTPSSNWSSSSSCSDSSLVVHELWLEEQRLRRQQQQQHINRYLHLSLLFLSLLMFNKWRHQPPSSPSRSRSPTGTIDSGSGAGILYIEDGMNKSSSSKSYGSDDDKYGQLLATTLQGRGGTGSTSIMDMNDKKDERLEKILHILKTLDEEIEGDIILVSSKEKFQDACKTWQKGNTINSPPLVVIEPNTKDDVTKIVPILTGLSRDYQLEFRIKSGGFSTAGFSTVSGGVILSMSKLKSLQINARGRNDDNIGDDEKDKIATQLRGTTTTTSPAAATTATSPHVSDNAVAILEPGVQVEQFLQTSLNEQGYASVVAEAAGIAMGGFLLGGGYGLSSRKYGLGIDNLVRLQVVLTNGDVQDVTSGDDLFWGLQGSGGGNLAIVTEIEYKIYPCNDMKLAAKVQIPFVDLPSFLYKLGKEEPNIPGEFIAKVDKYDAGTSRSSSTTFFPLSSKSSPVASMLHRRQQELLIPSTSMNDGVGHEHHQEQEHEHDENHHQEDEPITSFTSSPTKNNNVIGKSSSVTKSKKTTTTRVTDPPEDNGMVTISMYWFGDDANSDDDRHTGMDYIKEHIAPMLTIASDDNDKSIDDTDDYNGNGKKSDGLRTPDIDFYYFSWSGITRQKEQDMTWNTVWKGQTWNGFLLPVNNTQVIWQSIRENMSAIFKYGKNSYITPKIDLWGGQISKVSNNDTAFPYRQAIYNVGIELMVPNNDSTNMNNNNDDNDDDDAEQIFQQQSALISAIWPTIAQYLNGVYVNYPMSSLTQDEYANEYWGGVKNDKDDDDDEKAHDEEESFATLQRLMDLKQKYDPDNVLKFPQSIPTSTKISKNEMK